MSPQCHRDVGCSISETSLERSLPNSMPYGLGSGNRYLCHRCPESSSNVGTSAKSASGLGRRIFEKGRAAWDHIEDRKSDEIVGLPRCPYVGAHLTDREW
jgi:hypothetical protein